MSDRGDYRSFYVSMLDDPDFRDMSGDDFKIFFALRLTLGAAGIGVLRRLVICDQLKITPARLERRLASLEKPKPESDLGWIVWDRRNDIVWIVNALKYEPSLSSKNLNQRKYINGFLKPLSPHSNAVRGFWKAYPDWSLEPETDTKDDTHIEGDTQSPPDGVGMGPEGGLKHKRQATSDKRQETRDKKQATSDWNPSQSPEPVRVRFLRECYHDATPERLAEIEHQLDQVLKPEGLRLSRRPDDVVKARDEAHLNQVLSDILRGPEIRNRDRAIVIALKKLGDPPRDARGNVGTEITNEQNKAEVARANAYNRAARAAAKAWSETHPDELARIEAQAQHELPGESDFAETTRKAFVLQAICKLDGFPSFERWLVQQHESQKVPA